jgi:hypothetical protein
MPDRHKDLPGAGIRAIEPRRRQRQAAKGRRSATLAARADRTPAATPMPAEGLRLIRAFAQIGDAPLRRKIFEYVREMSRR